MSPSSHSKVSDKLIIFSVFQSGLTIRDNIINHDRIKNRLVKMDILFKEVEGIYKGLRELTFMAIIRNGMNDSEDIKDIAKEFNQESILLLGEITAHGIRKAVLHYPNIKYGVTGESIGYFRQRTKEIAQKEDSYTFDPATGNYFIVEKDYTQAVKLRSK